MYNRVAKTKTLDSAWALAKLLKAGCQNDFVLVLREQGGGAEVHPVGAFHPIDRARAKEIVKEFANQGTF